VAVSSSGSTWSTAGASAAQPVEHAPGLVIVRAQAQHLFQGAAGLVRVADGVRQQPPRIGIARIRLDDRHEDAHRLLFVPLANELIGLL
jgi:hypothetical protein